MSKTSLSILIELAIRDGEIDDKEHKLIHQIGRAHGFEEDEIHSMIQSPPMIIIKN